MIDLSGIRDNSWFGKLLRSPLHLVPKGIEVPILQGPIRGRRWVVGSSTHGCWLGMYEAAKVRKLASLVQPGMTCFDIGANVGYYTLLFSHLAGQAGKVIAFEPLPQNVDYLRRHVRTNRCKNVQIFDLALGDYNGMARFAENERKSMGRLSPSGGLSVRCATLESIMSESTISMPDVLKIDVEGGELAVMMGGRKILETARPVVFLATHGPDVHALCCRFLSDLGYKLESLEQSPVETSGELLAVAPHNSRTNADATIPTATAQATLGSHSNFD